MVAACLTVVAANAGAVRVLEILERSYELRLSRVTLPESTNGSVGYSRCATCVREYKAVGAETLYFVDGEPVTLAQMRQHAARITRSSGSGELTLVVVHFDPSTEIATRIRIESP